MLHFAHPSRIKAPLSGRDVATASSIAPLARLLPSFLNSDGLTTSIPSGEAEAKASSGMER